MSTEFNKPKRRFTRLARNVKPASTASATSNVVTVTTDQTVSTIATTSSNGTAKTNQAITTMNSSTKSSPVPKVASIPSDMLYILQELNGPSVESRESAIASSPAVAIKTRKSSRLEKIDIAQPLDTTAMPNDLLYIMNAMNGNIDTTTMDTMPDNDAITSKPTAQIQGKRANKRKNKDTKATMTSVEEATNSGKIIENAKSTRKQEKRKYNAANDPRSTNKRPSWTDRDQQAMDALEELTLPIKIDGQVDDDFNALLSEHIKATDNTNRKNTKRKEKSKASNTASNSASESMAFNPATKIRFCFQWQKDGYCERGDACPYSHEVPPEIAREAMKAPNQICRALRTHGTCPLGIRCPWSHDLSAITSVSKKDTPIEDAPIANNERDKPQTTTSNKPAELCRYFKSGSCGKGLWCTFSHDLKLEPCFFFAQRGYCAAGDECRFSHVAPGDGNTSTTDGGSKAENTTDKDYSSIPPEKWVPVLSATHHQDHNDTKIDVDQPLSFSGLPADLVYDP
ncbi:hypothetical protein BDF19DRAFT_448776 [Syncephalis fuscata]|nr:hypothetical protein BDF19DRAFT_448776 [Syncephalis fuscata]